MHPSCSHSFPCSNPTDSCQLAQQPLNSQTYTDPKFPVPLDQHQHSSFLPFHHLFCKYIPEVVLGSVAIPNADHLIILLTPISIKYESFLP